jgi:hypothetical protein
MFTIPHTIQRSSLQYAVLGIWGLGLILCIILIFDQIPNLTDRQLDISDSLLLKQANPKIYEAVEQEDWKKLRRRLAEISQQTTFSEDEWGKNTEAAKKLRSQMSPAVQQRVDAALGTDDWSTDWQRTAEALMTKDFRDKLAAAGTDLTQVAHNFIPLSHLNEKRVEQRRFMRTEYQKILVALCAPWVTVMISTILFGQATLRRQRIHSGAAAVVITLSLLFLVGLAWSLWDKLYGTKDASANPSDLIEPVVAFLATLVGTTVTFIFPEVDTDNRAPAGSTPQAPTS